MKREYNPSDFHCLCDSVQSPEDAYIGLISQRLEQTSISDTFTCRYLLPMTLPKGTILSSRYTGETYTLDDDMDIFLYDEEKMMYNYDDTVCRSVWEYVRDNAGNFTRPIIVDQHDPVFMTSINARYTPGLQGTDLMR